MNERIIVLIFIIILLAVVGCSYKKHSDTIISNSPFVITDNSIEFNCDPLLNRKYNSASIRIELESDWEPLPPWNVIELKDGKQVRVKVLLVSENGETFKSKILASAGGMLDVRFEPEIPKNVMIKQVRIKSDIPMNCKKILWHDYNAK